MKRLTAAKVKKPAALTQRHAAASRNELGTAIAAQPVTLTRNLIAERMSERNGEGFLKNKAAVNAVLNEIIEHLADGEPIELRGIGSFTVNDRIVRTCYTDFKSRKVIKHVKYRAAKSLKKRLNP